MFEGPRIQETFFSVKWDKVKPFGNEDIRAKESTDAGKGNPSRTYYPWGRDLERL